MSVVLRIEDLRSALNHPLPSWEGQKLMSVYQDEGLRKKGSSTAKKAAVMAILIEQSQEFIIIHRSTHPKDIHKGQLSFPGGKFDQSDVDLKTTALRETHEEIGLLLDASNVIGPLSPLFIPVSNFLVHPYVAAVEIIPELIPHPQEVDQIHFLPVKHLLDHRILRTDMQLSSGHFLKAVPYYPIKGEKVWGATAMILAELSTILRNHLEREKRSYE